MRTTLALVLLAAACGDDAPARKDASVFPGDDMQVIDAPMLPACPNPVNGTNITLRQLPSVSSAALLVTSPPLDERLFIVEREGYIRVMEDELLKTQPFLDISNLSGFVGSGSTGGEQGLLGLAFHPSYATNGQFFIYYTTGNANVVARYHVSATDINRADPAGEVILSIPDFAGNHNGGMVEFGNDGYLYIGTGDGGYFNDPCRNGQQLLRTGNCPTSPYTSVAKEPLLGKILRIDVDTTAGAKKYGIPPTNPYANGTNGEPEIFISGLRNPWRFSFDRLTGDLYIGDVGQATWEELTVLAPSQQPGANLGWSAFEGNMFFGNGYANDATGKTMPQLVKSQPDEPQGGPNDGWESIIAGQVYRGTCYPDIIGDFYFSDYSKHPLMRGRYDMGAFSATQVLNAPTGVTSIHADSRGELYLTTEAGGVYHIEAGP